MCVVLWVAVGMAGNLDTPGLRMRQPCTISPTWFTSQNRSNSHQTAHNAQVQMVHGTSDSESRHTMTHHDTPWHTMAPWPHGPMAHHGTPWNTIRSPWIGRGAKSITFSFKTSAIFRCQDWWSFQPSSSQTLHEVNISERKNIYKKHQKKVRKAKLHTSLKTC